MTFKNGSFEDGWSNMPPAPGSLINQQPNGYELSWVAPGDKLYESNDVCNGVPECVHKHRDQLPVEEQPGGVNALILNGDYVYKVFHARASFGAELVQVARGYKPGCTVSVTVPVQLHRHGDNDPYSAEFGVWVNGIGKWENTSLVDKTWLPVFRSSLADSDGEVVVVIRMKSKWNAPKDFFIDNILFEAEEGDAPVAETYDLWPYIRGRAGRQIVHQYTWSGGGTIPMQMLEGTWVDKYGISKPAFFWTKNDEWEMLWVDDYGVYRGYDTSEAPDKYYGLFQSGGGTLGIVWLLRHQKIGSVTRLNPLVVHFWKSNCAVRASSVVPSELHFSAHHTVYRLDQGNGRYMDFYDAIELCWPLGGERWIYAKNYGLIEWSGPAGRSYLVESYDDRRPLLRKLIPCMDLLPMHFATEPIPEPEPEPEQRVVTIRVSVDAPDDVTINWEFVQ